LVYIILTAASAAAYCFVLKAPEDGQGHEDLGTHFRSLADHCRAYVVVDGWEGVPLSSVSVWATCPILPGGFIEMQGKDRGAMISFRCNYSG
jgi:hypothetical protein